MTETPIIPISAIEHFVYCPRQCALIHCDGVWSDNVHTVRGSRAHRRVDSGRHRRERGRLVLRSIPLWSETLGLSGRADAVEIEPATDEALPPTSYESVLSDRADMATLERCTVRPVEYKSGVRHGTAADLQLCAQALCLEEMLGVDVPDGHVWYGGPRRKVPVAFTSALRDEVRAIIQEIRTQLLTPELPVAPNDRRCSKCQLRHHCLPELTAAPNRVNRYMATVVFRCAT